jgi:hypothetical protein
VTVSANASDAGSIGGVTFKADGVNIGTEDTTSPYSVSWNTTGIANGSHTLTAVARDPAGNTTTSAGVTVTVNNTAAPSLIASYNFNEGSGTSLTDRTGRGHTGAVANATWAAGNTGGALAFNGSTSLVTIADANDLDLTSAMTLEAWVKPAAAAPNWRTILMKERTGGLTYALYGDNAASRPTGYMSISSSDRSVTGPTALAADTWTHVAVTYGSGTFRLYVNGTEVATAASTGNMAASTGALRMGGNNIWGEFFTGSIDDVRIYNRALTAAEVATDRTMPVS